MPYKHNDIQKILPKNEVHWKLLFCPKRRLTQNECHISIELNDRKRQYTCVSFEQLYELIKKIREDSVKFYLDYEYYKNDQNNKININKSLSYIQQLFVNVINILSIDKNISIHDMLP
jgi:hypothetical protein